MPKTKEKEKLGLVCATRIRELTGGNPKVLAYDCGVGLSATYNYINGRLPATDVLYRIAKHYGKPMEWFLDPEQFKREKAAENLLSLCDVPLCTG